MNFIKPNVYAMRLDLLKMYGWRSMLPYMNHYFAWRRKLCTFILLDPLLRYSSLFADYCDIAFHESQIS